MYFKLLLVQIDTDAADHQALWHMAAGRTQLWLIILLFSLFGSFFCVCFNPVCIIYELLFQGTFKRDLIVEPDN